MSQPVDAIPQAESAAAPAATTATTTKSASASRRAAAAAGFDESELSFLDFLGQVDPVEPTTLTAHVTLQAAPAKEAEKSAGSKAEKTTEKTKTPETEPAKEAKSTHRGESPDDADDFDLLMDRFQIQPNDVRLLQQLGQGVPAPQVMLQNLSPSLVSAMPSDYYKSLGVSKGLQDMMETAYKTQRPLRIDLADDAAVIIRMSREGKVSAEFLPADQAADLYYRQYLSDLKNRMDAKGLPVGELAVRSWQEQQKRQDRHQSQDEGNANA